MITAVELGHQEFTHPRPPRTAKAGVYGATLALHVIVILSLLYVPRVEVGVAGPGPSGGGIAAFIDPGTAGTSGMAEPEVRKVTLVSSTPAPQTPTPDAPSGQGSHTGGAAAADVGDGSGGPVRIGSGLSAISKVNPVYPPIMERARLEGTVVLDAIIRRDGSVGDIRVLQSTSPAFEQAAIAAVSQWRYTPLPYEGVLTVRVNFTLPH